MTVGELIKELERYEAGAPVLVSSGEYGFDAVVSTQPAGGFRTFTTSEHWHGDFDRDDTYQDVIGEEFSAVVLLRPADGHL